MTMQHSDIHHLFNPKEDEFMPMTDQGVRIASSVMGRVEISYSGEQLFHKLLSLKAPPLLMIMAGRLRMSKDAEGNQLRYKVGTVSLMLPSITNPGKAVMWAYSLFRTTLEYGRVVEPRDYVNVYGAMMPTDDFMHNMWDSQKVKGPDAPFGGNWLDTPPAWVP